MKTLTIFLKEKKIFFHNQPAVIFAFRVNKKEKAALSDQIKNPFETNRGDPQKTEHFSSYFIKTHTLQSNEIEIKNLVPVTAQGSFFSKGCYLIPSDY
jgi:hypothetical protein